MRIGRVAKTVQKTARNNPEKKIGYKLRNWHGYDENGVKQVTTPPAKKLTKLQKAKLEAEKKAKNTLERTPERDVLDISGEENGFFKIGEKIFETKFPR